MAQAAKCSNVILIFGDQHRQQALGCNGDPNVDTPHIDRLANDGLVDTAAVSGTPLCCPYRGSLLTSQYPHKCVPGHEDRMPPEMPTVATAFNEAGYHTAYFGKWHVDGYNERAGRAGLHVIPPERRGHFQQWLGFENNNSQWDCWVHGDTGRAETSYKLPGYETDELTDMLIGYIKARGDERMAGKGQPFFAVLSVQPPHDPYVAPAEWMQRHNPARVQLRANVPAIPRVVEQARREIAGYYAMIENLDWNVGRIRQALVNAGLDDDTHVIFFSDHGDMHGSHGMFRKTNPYEESVRVPMIISGGPARYRFHSGRRPLLMNHVDVAPTSLGLCGIDKPGWMAGTDYSGRRIPGRAAMSEPDSAYIQLVKPTRHHHSTDRAWRGVVTRDGWKYVCLEYQPWLMFNLNEDPYELANLAHNSLFGAQRKKLHDRLTAWINDTGDSFALPEL